MFHILFLYIPLNHWEFQQGLRTTEQLDEDRYFDVTQIAKRFDNNEKFVRSVILFLKEINWLKESKDGKFAVTRRAKLEMSYLKIVKQ